MILYVSLLRMLKLSFYQYDYTLLNDWHQIHMFVQMNGTITYYQRQEGTLGPLSK